MKKSKDSDQQKQVDTGRRNAIKIGLATAGTGVVSPARGENSLPSIVSFLLDSDVSMSCSADLEGEGPGSYFGEISSPANTVNLVEGSNTVADFHELFRPDFGFFRFGNIQVQLDPGSAEDVTLTASVTSGDDLTFTSPSQTLTASSEGMVTFSDLTLSPSDFGPSDSVVKDDHTFNLVFRSQSGARCGMDVTINLSKAYPDIGVEFDLEGEGPINPATENGANTQSYSVSTANNNLSETLDGFFSVFRPDLTPSGGRPAIGFNNISLTLDPISAREVNLSVSRTAGTQINVDTVEDNQSAIPDAMTGIATFNKIELTPANFGSATMTEAHTFRFRFSLDGTNDGVDDVVIDVTLDPATT